MNPNYLFLQIRFCVRWKYSLRIERGIESFETADEARHAIDSNPSDYERHGAEQFVGLYARVPDPDTKALPAGLLQHIGDWDDYDGARDMLDILSGSTEAQRLTCGNRFIYDPVAHALKFPAITLPDAVTCNQLADALESGATADIWYDADDFADADAQIEGLEPDENGDLPETGKQRTIREAQEAMLEAAKIFRGNALPDGPGKRLIRVYEGLTVTAKPPIFEAPLERYFFDNAEYFSQCPEEREEIAKAVADGQTYVMGGGAFGQITIIPVIDNLHMPEA